MTKLSFLLLLLGCLLFFTGIPNGIGWVIGWIFISILRNYREKVLDYVIDFKDFSIARYVLYLVGVIVWIAIPIAAAFVFPKFINPIAVFGAYFVDRILMFITKPFLKEER